MATTHFAQVQSVLNRLIDVWKRNHGGQTPDLEGQHDPGFGWGTKPQLLAASARGFQLIEPGVPGAQTFLIQALGPMGAPGGAGRMPHYRRHDTTSPDAYATDAERALIAQWIDEGTPD